VTSSLPPAPPPASPPPPPPAGGWYAPPPVQTATTNGFAVASLVLGIAVLCTGIIGGILAVIFGYMALGRIAESNGRQRGRAMAITGIVLGWIAIGLTAIAAIAWLGYGISNL
jgi:Domain of unknown function (DUF4190)